MFKQIGGLGEQEIAARRALIGSKLSYGVEYLDDATRGIFPDDLILLGAPSGAGKTQLCCNIALANLAAGRKVHYIALEASEWEIEHRLKYPLVAERFFADPYRPKVRLTYPDWVNGELLEELSEYEKSAAKFFDDAFRDLFVFYKQNKFGIDEMLQTVAFCAAETSLVIIDHVHYFDWDDDNENRAIKKIAMTARRLSLEEKKPIILVAHLRKKDRGAKDLVPGIEEFHGSSDLTKIATTVVTMSPGGVTSTGNYETFFRISKSRRDGGVTRYIGREFFSPRKGGYENGKYQIGWSGCTAESGFEEIPSDDRPSWCAVRGESNRDDVSRRQESFGRPEVPRYVPGGD